MRPISRLSAVGTVAFSLAAGACSSDRPASDVSPGAAIDDSGAVGLQLVLAPGVNLDSVSYTITGPGGFVQSGMIDLRNSATLSAIISGLPAGKGYTITINGAIGDAGTTCVGSTAFDVTAHTTTLTIVQVQCREPPSKGGVQVGGAINICPVADGLAASVGEVFVGGTIALSGTAHDTDNGPSPLSYQWTATSGTLTGATSPNATFTCTAVGPSTVRLTVSDGNCTDSLSATLTCTAAPGVDAGAAPAIVKINEVESSGGIPDDWVELTNVGGSTADLSGWIVKDNDDTHLFVIPAGTMLAPGAFLALDVAVSFGLGASDSARIYDPSLTLVDTYTWTSHATTTYGRCPDGTGPFVTTIASTKGTANACPVADAGTSVDATSGADAASEASSSSDAGDGGLTFVTWPGANAVVTADTGPMGGNMSGLEYQPAAGGSPAILWAVQNSPSKIYQMTANAGISLRSPPMTGARARTSTMQRASARRTRKGSPKPTSPRPSSTCRPSATTTTAA
jgi:hypothetical protein